MSDSKSPIPRNNPEVNNDSIDDNINPPPTYSECIASPSSLPPPHPQLHHQFQSLITQITNTRLQNALTQSTQLQKSLTLLTAQIDPFFTSISTTGLTKGTLYLIPRGCISAKAKLANLDLKGADEVLEVREVGGDGEKGGDRVELGYWRDEALARKLAGDLQPKKEERTSKNEVSGSKSKSKSAVSPSSPSSTKDSKSSWWRRKSNAPPSSPSTSSINSSSIPFQTPGETADVKIDPASSSKTQSGETGKANVEMKVTAEEVVFRSENSFGLWTTERGWAVVMRFVVVLGQ